jgi:hypothetical protein
MTAGEYVLPRSVLAQQNRFAASDRHATGGGDKSEIVLMRSQQRENI